MEIENEEFSDIGDFLEDLHEEQPLEKPSRIKSCEFCKNGISFEVNKQMLKDLKFSSSCQFDKMNGALIVSLKSQVHNERNKEEEKKMSESERDI